MRKKGFAFFPQFIILVRIFSLSRIPQRISTHRTEPPLGYGRASDSFPTKSDAKYTKVGRQLYSYAFMRVDFRNISDKMSLTSIHADVRLVTSACGITSKLLWDESSLVLSFKKVTHRSEPPLCKGRWLPNGQTEGLSG